MITKIRWLERFFLFLLLVRFFHGPFFGPGFEGDTANVMWGAQAIAKCIQEGKYAPCEKASYFPLLQYIPAVPAALLGFSDHAILKLLLWFTLAGFLISHLLIWFILRKRFPGEKGDFLGKLGVLILATSAFFFYHFRTFSEPFAAALVLIFTWMCLENKKPIYVFLTFLLASFSKSTAFPFLILIGVVGLKEPLNLKSRENWRRYLTLVSGTIIAVVIALAFDYYRFGSFENPVYFHPNNVVPNLRLQAHFFFGLLFSLNGGIIWYLG